MDEISRCVVVFGYCVRVQISASESDRCPPEKQSRIRLTLVSDLRFSSASRVGAACRVGTVSSSVLPVPYSGTVAQPDQRRKTRLGGVPGAGCKWPRGAAPQL